VTIESFTDYAAALNILPRVSFSFPVTENSVFYAHYDVLVQRPRPAILGPAINQTLFFDYEFLTQNATESIRNGALLPEKTIDYEIGYNQFIGRNIKLGISAYYREMRNMVQSFRNQNAYPITYDSFLNLDFGTVKGFSADVTYTRDANLRFNIAYTLQFAEGTGSDFSSSRNVLGSVEGFSALRVLLPLSYDQRHTVVANVDYHFNGDMRGNGIGPAIKIGGKTYHPLRNAGVNLLFNMGSGTPYTRQAIPNPSAMFGVVTSNQTLGQPFGSQLPSTFRLDLRVDKSFSFSTGKGGKDKDGNERKKREWNFNVYLSVINLLNTQNIVGVYAYSGLPNDDGYLNSAIAQQNIPGQIDPRSFVDLYNLKVNSPFNYSTARRMRLGIMFNF
jgi:hypothetical protein